MRFDYYERLSERKKAIYRKSDSLTAVPMPSGMDYGPQVDAVRRALESEKLGSVQRALSALSNAVCTTLGTTSLEVKVKARRPTRRDGEYHGLYEREEGGDAVLTLWMRTAKHKKVVAFKTLLRTFVHELCHHLDFELFGLKESFHTQGFFKRESSLYRTLAPQKSVEPKKERTAPDKKGDRVKSVEPKKERTAPDKKRDRVKVDKKPPLQIELPFYK